jgi:hypothetical protein
MELTKMTTPHKLAKLLRQAADDADARFRCGIGVNEVTGDISFVVNHQDWMWKLVEKPDPYAELKKAYAEGKTIQYRYRKGGNPTEGFMYSEWSDHKYGTLAEFGYEYRIKPQTVTKWLWADSLGRVSIALCEVGYNGYTTKLEWSATTFEVTE